MQTIACPHCKKIIELSQAISEQISDEQRRAREEELAKVRLEEQLRVEKRLKEESMLKEKDYENQLREDRERREKLTEDLLKSQEEMRALRQKDEERALENQKKLSEMEEKIKQETTKKISEEKQFEILQMKKQLEDTQKALEEAKRKSEQVSQQLQGEVLELELEEMLRSAFPMDVIEPVGKGITGADIRHIVKTPMGNTCGVILWEFKRTKHWEDRWITKLKDDLRGEGANIPVIVSQALPKEAENGMGIKDKVWVCNFSLVLPLAEILRSSLYDVAKEKARQTNSVEKAAVVYSYLTSHEFAQQIESIVEVYTDQHEQLNSEKKAFDRIWKSREMQIARALRNTANIVGSLQGIMGESTLQIKGLELLEAGE